MKQRFRMFRRGNYFWSHDGKTGKQETLRTKDKATAQRLLHAKNEAHQQPVLNLQIARTYLTASDPEIGKRTWQTVMNERVSIRISTTREWRLGSTGFGVLRNTAILPCQPVRSNEVTKSRAIIRCACWPGWSSATV
jgi:hypothetical protein